MKSFLEKYLQKKVRIVIDRPMGSKHPKFGDIYPINYGFLPNIKAPDGEEIDVYVLGVGKPLKEFEGITIAIIHRLDDNDDKLVVVPEEKSFSDKEIRNLTNFQEQYFKSEIIR